MEIENNEHVAKQTEIEIAAEEVLMYRAELLELDRKRQSNREGLRALQKMDNDDKVWILLGQSFIKIPVEKALKAYQQEKLNIEKKVNECRDDTKNKVDLLCKLEGAENRLAGFNLKSLNQEEAKTIKWK
ncbi:p53 and DNA damage-regulated protein 1 [Trichinella papuae]|uniref:p53 and DNA damage-regulated protein 1 n=1 Tax=Trichinella papuae TaxID=268474 RepID=A0A0V1N9M9_9BILA|nr:p53 and DNA damage-regulated protein 1 [Trichinella papuae]